MEISVVLPCFNESESMKFSIPKIIEILRNLKREFEVIVVNDGSYDDSIKVINDFKVQYPELKVVSLVRNFGHQSAMLAGISQAKGQWVITMDIDLQDPPNLIEEMLETARQNKVCLVLTQRNSRKSDSWFKRNSARMFYKLLKILNSSSLSDSGDFRLMHRCVVDHLKTREIDSAPLRLYLPWTGFGFKTVSYIRDPRVSGETKYSIGKMLKLTLDSYLAFGVKPLRLLSLFGFLLGSFSALLGLIEYVIWLQGRAIPGFTTVVLPLLFANATIMLSIGLLGEYLAVVLSAVRNRPKYIIDDCPNRRH